MTTEYDTRADSPESYDPFPELTFPSGLSSTDLYDMVRERPRDSLPFASGQTTPQPGSTPALS
jgi:hypothetical protein